MSIKVIDLNYTYGAGTAFEQHALKHVNFEINDGEFVGLIGHTGSGKSTLINNLSTIDMPTKGKVKINGVDVYSMLESQTGKFRYENLGFIFQSFNLMDTLTLKENIALPLTLSNMSKEEIGKRVQQTAERLELVDILDKYPVECSGGQCQRCAVARALINKPKLIVADEPTGSLDSKNSHTLLTILKELNEREKVTILMVTHDAMIASYSRRLLYLRDGCIEEDLERADMDQKEYFYKIVQINSKESMELLFS